MTDLTSIIAAELVRFVPNIGAPDQIDPDTRLAQDLGVTSMQIVLLITTLCRALGVPMTAFDESDLAAMTTIADIAARFAPHLPAKAA